MHQRNREFLFNLINMNTAKSIACSRVFNPSSAKEKASSRPPQNQLLSKSFKSAPVPLGIGGSSCCVHSMVFLSV
jgi:hypothetical protein